MTRRRRFSGEGQITPFIPRERSCIACPGRDMMQVREKNGAAEEQEGRLMALDDPWNGMFDFNGDGVTDIGEEYLAYRIFEAVTGEPEEDGEEEEQEG